MTVLPTEIGLSVMMRDGSQAEHKDAEGSSFMASLLDGKVNETGYTEYLAMLRPVYAALESVAATLADDPIAGAIIDPALNRLEAIDRDLDFWTRGAGAPAISSPAVERYVARIEATVEDPTLFVAHHYTRYLGDLSGGQFIGRLMARRFGFDTNGIGFYLFEDIADPQAFKDVYREQLDAAPWDAEEKERVIDEVLLAYRFNTELFEDLAAAKAAQVA